MIARAVLLSLLAGSSCAADLAAQLDWSQRVEIAASVPGIVEAVHVQPGQRVPKGTPLLILNQTLTKAGLMETRADLARLGQEQLDAKRELERASELYARTVSSTTELDAAKLRATRADALLAAAEARAEKARRLLDESEPRAPFEALILDRTAEPGLAVTSQCQPTVLLTLARADEILARATLAIDKAVSVKPGMAATVLTAGQTLTGRVMALRARADGHYQIDVAVPRDEGLLAGMAATIRLP